MAKKEAKQATVTLPIFTTDGEGAYYPIDAEKYTKKVNAQEVANDLVYLITAMTEFDRGDDEGFDFEEMLSEYEIFVSDEDLEEFLEENGDED